eukprot:g35051.t1
MLEDRVYRCEAEKAQQVRQHPRSRHETVNINLLNKPDWFFEKNPLGMVPILETCKNELVYESPITCEFLDDTYPAKRLLPTDPYEKAKQKMLLEQFSKRQVQNSSRKGKEKSRQWWQFQVLGIDLKI